MRARLIIVLIIFGLICGVLPLLGCATSSSTVSAGVDDNSEGLAALKAGMTLGQVAAVFGRGIDHQRDLFEVKQSSQGRVIYWGPNAKLPARQRAKRCMFKFVGGRLVAWTL